MKPAIALLGILGLTMVLAGCASLRPLASTPPAAVIELTEPMTIRYALQGDTILPAGEYRATLEDNGGYYYAAPAKLIRNDTVGWQLDGGLYLKKGAQMPTHYYVVGQHHATGLYRLKTEPKCKLKP
ncbi:MAG: hypothetical protein KIS67_08655 [Verrucomicrobiae bacterium]|nr:hypothetical protein [Verrucomicrobiae bacterium]